MHVYSERHRAGITFATMSTLVAVILSSSVAARAGTLKIPNGNPTKRPVGVTNTSPSVNLTVTVKPVTAQLVLSGNCPWLLPALSAQGFAVADPEAVGGYTGENGWTIDFGTLAGSFTLNDYYSYADSAPEVDIGGLSLGAIDRPGSGGDVFALTYKGVNGTDPLGADAEWIQVVQTNVTFGKNAPQSKYGFNAGDGFTDFIDDFYAGNTPSNNGTMNPTFDGGYKQNGATFTPQGFTANPTTFLDVPNVALKPGLDVEFQAFLATENAKTLTIYDGVWWGFTANAPEPGAGTLLAGGLVLLAVAMRKNRWRRARTT